MVNMDISESSYIFRALVFFLWKKSIHALQRDRYNSLGPSHESFLVFNLRTSAMLCTGKEAETHIFLIHGATAQKINIIMLLPSHDVLVPDSLGVLRPRR